ncbi:hypothetical protein [Aerococcus sp. Group 1]|uniref:hypothetical protein n=1 Tax=Aerococcus urinae (strain CCUG 59500 / ACS-120-V-Col10a) TaxID=2976812 RepID=UPI00227D42C1|nr:hypothetical protein [Aerococcus sp. Group 1]MCY3030616.1 hypothetical protein [Aerococcus sp. Group 1]
MNKNIISHKGGPDMGNFVNNFKSMRKRSQIIFSLISGFLTLTTIGFAIDPEFPLDALIFYAIVSLAIISGLFVLLYKFDSGYEARVKKAELRKAKRAKEHAQLMLQREAEKEAITKHKAKLAEQKRVEKEAKAEQKKLEKEEKAKKRAELAEQRRLEKEAKDRKRKEDAIKAAREYTLEIGFTKIRKDVNGLYYFGKFSEEAPRYKLEKSEFSGSTYKEVTKTNGKNKKSGRLGGAVVGGLVAGPVGAAVGAMATGKDKHNSTSTTEIQEVRGKGKFYFRNVEDQTIKQVDFFAKNAEYESYMNFFND